ncbi:hypothetical protein ACWD4V_34080 [Streptomyces tsukubensis]
MRQDEQEPMDDERLFVADELFGVPALMGAFHQDWRNVARTPEELVAWWVGGEGGEDRGSAGAGSTDWVSLLVQDALRLVRSPLTEQEITELWSSCYQAGIPRGADWTWGRSWMTRIARIGTARLADRGVQNPLALPACRHGAPDPDLLAFADRLPVAFAAAWTRCAERVCPELALRFLTTGLYDTSPDLTPNDLRVLGRLGREYGYGEEMLEVITFLAAPE